MVMALRKNARGGRQTQADFASSVMKIVEYLQMNEFSDDCPEVFDDEVKGPHGGLDLAVFASRERDDFGTFSHFHTNEKRKSASRCCCSYSRAIRRFPVQYDEKLEMMAKTNAQPEEVTGDRDGKASERNGNNS